MTKSPEASGVHVLLSVLYSSITRPRLLHFDRPSQEYEEETLLWWDKKHIYESVNKILKDVVIRFKRMRGYKVRDQPGYDCHGLPIEVMVEERLGVKTKKEIGLPRLGPYRLMCRHGEP